jgi:hypothetical protein
MSVPKIPSRIFEIVQQLKENKQPRRATVRSVLKWFDAARRGSKVMAEIQETLAVAGVDTEPPFAEAGIDKHVRFVLRSSDTATSLNGSPSVANEVQVPAIVAVPRSSEMAGDAATTPANYASEIPSHDFLEPEGDDAPTPGKADDRPVTSQPHDWTLSTLRDKWDRGQLELQPAYQREYVWKLRPELPSRLIESLLLEIPIPPIYFGKIENGRLEVIDGQQRLTTMINFISNTFHLQRLQRMGSLNGKLFRELSDEDQNRVLDAPIRSIVIDAGKNTELRYEVFERLNRGSMVLNEQELRNCVYRGPFNELLAKLEHDANWRRVRGTPVPEPRFVEREVILRFFAFVNRLQFYTGNLKRFLNEYMASYAPRDPDQIGAQESIFKQAIQNMYAVFGANSARLYSLDPRSNKGAWDTKFSVAALDIQASAVVGKPPAKVQAAAEQIREQYLYTLLTDPMLQAAISKQTGATVQTKYRWTAFKTLADPIIDGQLLEPRFFDYAFRRQLFDRSPLCKICGNEIHAFEDSTVDHIHPYSKDGKTVQDNGQLAHRSCNARKNMSLPSAPATPE